MQRSTRLPAGLRHVATRSGALVLALLVAAAGLVALALHSTGHATAGTRPLASLAPTPSAAGSVAPPSTAPVTTAAPAPATVTVTVPAPVSTSVAPLKAVEEPDAFVTLPSTVTSAQLTAAQAIPFVTGLAVADTGQIHLGALAAAIQTSEPSTSASATGVAPAAAVSTAPASTAPGAAAADPLVHVLGVDPSSFRAFTPAPTASSDALWSSLARNELTLDYGLGIPAPSLGTNTVISAGKRDLPMRLGAFAATGLPHAGALVTDAVAKVLGFRTDNAIVLTAPQADPTELTAKLKAVFGTSATVELLGRFAVDQSLTPASGTSSSGRPTTYKGLYQAAATTCPGLSWTVLAAIGQIESDHGKNIGPSSAGALGPMQFLPSTWAKWGRDADGDGKADILDPFDAVYTAAAYLCSYDPGASLANLRAAVFAYNHADWYVNEVLALAVRYS